MRGNLILKAAIVHCQDGLLTTNSADAAYCTTAFIMFTCILIVVYYITYNHNPIDAQHLIRDASNIMCSAGHPPECPDEYMAAAVANDGLLLSVA